MEIQRRELEATDEGPPGWELKYLAKMEDEGRKLLNPLQYAYAVEQFTDLAYLPDPTHSPRHSIGKVEDFYELREKGSVLGKLNLRIFYGVEKARKTIVGLGVYKKEEEGLLSDHVRLSMRSRWKFALASLNAVGAPKPKA